MEFLLINLSALTNAALFQFITLLVGIIDRIGADKLKIKTQVDVLLIPALENFDKAHKKEVRSDYSVRLKELSTIIIQKISGVNGIIKVSAFDSDIKKKESAAKIKNWTSVFKEMSRKPIGELGGEVTNYIQGFRGKYSVEMDILGLTKWIDEIEEANIQLMALIAKRFDERDDKNLLNTVDAKKKLISAYRTVFKLIDVMIETEGNANYIEFIRKVNVLIGAYTNNSGKTLEDEEQNVPPANNTDNEENNLPNNPVEDTTENEYPDAIEWVENYGVQNAADGMIFYIVVDGKKIFYKLLDRAAVGFVPGGTKYQEYWEKLN